MSTWLRLDDFRSDPDLFMTYHCRLENREREMVEDRIKRSKMQPKSAMPQAALASAALPAAAMAAEATPVFRCEL